MKKTVIIAAAGMGSRLGAGKPKCLVEVGGHAVFEYQLKAFQWADEIRMVVGYMADEVIARVSAVNRQVVFIHNQEFSSTSTLQSNFLGSQGLEGNALFMDGDMIISRRTADAFRRTYEAERPFIGVARDLSKEPVYAGVNDGHLQWFSYDRPSEYEWANAALLDVKKLEFHNTHFYVQLEKFLPMEALVIDRLELDTPEDLQHAEQVIAARTADYDFWENDDVSI